VTPPVTAILVSYNSAAVIGDALRSLPDGTTAIVVDNASVDDGSSIARSLSATVIRRSDNAGFGMANNDGIEAATTPYVLLLNPDARLRPGCIDALLAAAERHPDAALLVPTLLKPNGERFQKWSSPICTPAFRPRPESDPAVRDIAFASGAVILARRDVLNQLGGFDPAIFLYFEDDDLSRRVIDKGLRILHVADAVADHVGNASSPPSLAMTAMKHWHLAWSEHHVRRKHSLRVWSRWRILESSIKGLLARMRSDRNEQAKQSGLLNGTRAALKGVKAQDVRATVGGF
jgi:N-acetylglucosaminyl-diphospho-decaprenol L-rhamnosyltransferase